MDSRRTLASVIYNWGNIVDVERHFNEARDVTAVRVVILAWLVTLLVGCEARKTDGVQKTGSPGVFVGA